jgi:hypothetical protein
VADETPDDATPVPPEDPLGLLLRWLGEKGLRHLEHGARRGKSHMERSQGRRDLATLYQKIGRETMRLIEAGEIDHPGLLERYDRIRAQEEVLERGPVDGEALEE